MKYPACGLGSFGALRGFHPFHGSGGIGGVTQPLQALMPVGEGSMAGVKRGAGPLTEARTDPLWLPDHQGVLREFLSGEPGIEGGRVVRNIVEYPEGDFTDKVASSNGDTNPAEGGAVFSDFGFDTSIYFPAVEGPTIAQYTYLEKTITPVVGNRYVAALLVKVDHDNEIVLDNAATGDFYFYSRGDYLDKDNGDVDIVIAKQNLGNRFWRVSVAWNQVASSNTFIGIRRHSDACTSDVWFQPYQIEDASGRRMTNIIEDDDAVYTTHYTIRGGSPAPADGTGELAAYGAAYGVTLPSGATSSQYAYLGSNQSYILVVGRTYRLKVLVKMASSATPILETDGTGHLCFYSRGEYLRDSDSDVATTKTDLGNNFWLIEQVWTQEVDNNVSFGVVKTTGNIDSEVTVQIIELADIATESAPSEYVSRNVASGGLELGDGVDGLRVFSYHLGNEVNDGVLTLAKGDDLDELPWFTSMPEATNQIPYDRDWSFHSKSSTQVSSADNSAPDGTSSATLLVSSTASDIAHTTFYDTSITNGETYVYSLYLKASGVRWVQFAASTGFNTNAKVNFDLTTMTVGNVNILSAGDYGIEDVGNGWSRCWIKLTATSDTASGRVFTAFCADDSLDRVPTAVIAIGAGVQVWGNQLEKTVLTPIIKTDGAADARDASDLRIPSGNIPDDNGLLVLNVKNINTYVTGPYVNIRTGRWGPIFIEGGISKAWDGTTYVTNNVDATALADGRTQVWTTAWDATEGKFIVGNNDSLEVTAPLGAEAVYDGEWFGRTADCFIFYDVLVPVWFRNLRLYQGDYDDLKTKQLEIHA